MYIGIGEGITVLRNTTANIGSGLGSTLVLSQGYSWVTLSSDGTSLTNITGTNIENGSYLLITADTFIPIQRTTGTLGSIWFESSSLGSSIGGSIPASTSGIITLTDDMSALLQKQADNSWLVLTTTGGRDGMQGDQGSQGNRGTQGAQGFTGGDGPAGVDGAQGSQGIAGLQGPNGADGNIGPQGDQGTTGFAGPSGNQGPVGNTGAPC